MLSSSVLQISPGPDDGVPAAFAAHHLGVSVAAVKGWAARGLIEAIDTDRRWGRLYRWRDLVEAELATADSPNRRSARASDAFRTVHSGGQSVSAA